MDQKKIGRFLKELRKEKDITQEQLAEKIKVSGRTEPSITGRESWTQTESQLISTVKHVKRSTIEHRPPPER